MQLLPDSDVAEIMTLKYGVLFAKDMLFLNLILEHDSVNAIEYHLSMDAIVAD
jgi:hypothetical protein